MKLLYKYENADRSFPYFYLPSFAEFQKQEDGSDIIFVCDGEGNSMCCKVRKNKFLKLAQVIYPPLSAFAERLEESREQVFVDEFIDFIKKNRIFDRITQPENFAIFRTFPSQAIRCRFGTYFIDLRKQTELEIIGNMHVKHRNVIRNAEKNNIVLKYGSAVVEDFYLLYQKTMERSAMYCQPHYYFKKLYEHMEGNVICGVAYFNDVPQGGLFMPYTKFGAFYVYGASAEKIEINGTINYLHWNTMKLLKEKDVSTYDFVGARLSDITGTKLEGIQNFKKRFGAQLSEGYLWKSDISSLKCRVYDTLLKIKCRLKGTNFPVDIIDQERQKQITL